MASKPSTATGAITPSSGMSSPIQQRPLSSAASNFPSEQQQQRVGTAGGSRVGTAAGGAPLARTNTGIAKGLTDGAASSSSSSSQPQSNLPPAISTSSSAMQASAASALGSPSGLAAALGGPAGGHRFRHGAASAASAAAASAADAQPVSGGQEALKLPEEEDLSMYEDSAEVKKEKWDGALPPIFDPFDPAFDPAVLTGVRTLPPADKLCAVASAGDWKLLIRMMTCVPVTHLVEYVNQFDAQGLTALFYACEKPEQSDALETLLHYGANPNVQSRAPTGQPYTSGLLNTPLHHACRRLNKRAVRLLIYRGARTDLENTAYESCYQHVSEAGGEEQKSAMAAFVQKCEEEYAELVDTKRINPAITLQQRATYKYIFDAIDRENRGVIHVRDISALLVQTDADNEHALKLPDPEKEIAPYQQWLESFYRDAETAPSTKLDFHAFLHANVAHLTAKAKWLKKLAKKQARLAKRKAAATARAANPPPPGGMANAAANAAAMIAASAAASAAAAKKG